MRDCIQLAACGPHETLPMTPELPADLFTSCLTSPIEMALRFYALQDPLKAKRGGATGDSASSLPRGKVTIEMVAKIPGELKDRRTPLGELNWIFTSVTDTIAWLVLPRDLFRRLFRHDLLVAALFRNFLLAERIMRNYNCTPRSEPPLPATYNHPLWDSWDATVEACLNQLPLLIRAEASARDPTLPPFEHKYVPSNFYVEHLTALDVWLTSSGVVSRPLSIAGQTPPALSLVHSERRPPVQLPIVLQVLLSQAHRLRALILLSKFVDLGSWAVLEALDIGVFPYVSRLLQSPAMELRPVLIFIWSRILAVDRSCQTDLLKENGFHYFASILSPYTNAATPLMIPNASEHRAMCAFILAVFCRDFRAGQQACLASDVFASCLLRLKDDDYLLRQWGPLCIAQLWDGNDEAKGIGLQLGGPNMLCQMLQDNSVEVRAAVLYALGTFFGCSGSSNPDAKGGGGSGVQLSRTERDQLRTEIGIATSAVLAVNGDASPMVRKELIIMLSAIVREWRGWFVSAAWTYWEQENCRTRGWDERGPKGYVVEALREWATFPREDQVEGQIEEDQMILSSCNTIFTALLEMSVDPYAEVATLACTVVDYITALLLDSAFMNAENSSVRLSQFVVSPKLGSPNQPRSRPSSALHTSANLSAPSPSETAFPFPSSNLPPSIARTQTGINHQHQSMSSRPSPKAKPSHLKRSHSFAARLMNLTGLAPPSEPESPHEDIEALPPPSPFGTAHYQAPYAVNRSSTTVDLPATIAVSSRPSTLGSSLPSSATFFKPLTSTTMTKNNTSDGESEIVYPPCTAAEVIHALAEEDMERLMIRRWAGSEAGGVPSGSHGRTNDLGIGHVAREVKDDVLPLKSRFFDWSCEYYTEPQMRVSSLLLFVLSRLPVLLEWLLTGFRLSSVFARCAQQSEADEPGSVKYNEQLWRRERNEEIDKQAVISADRVAADILAHNGDSSQFTPIFFFFEPFFFFFERERGSKV
jgi:regulator-associated protein of mTOR